MRALRTTLLTLMAVTVCGRVQAHDPGLSSSRVDVLDDAVEAVIRIDDSDVATVVPDPDGDGRIDAIEVEELRDALRAWILRNAQLRTTSGELRVTSVAIDVAPNEDIRFRIRTGPARSSKLEWHAGFVDRLPRGHRHFAEMHANSRPVGDGVLAAGHTTLRADLGGGDRSALATLGSFVALGVEHILIGWDHLLFLLMLLIGGPRLKSAALTITAFTIAHSITLGVAALDLIRLPSAFVESVIALSIVWLGVETLLRKQPRRLWTKAFGFGLVHGFGFASVLRELGIGGENGIFAPLLGFNLGVELGQLAVAALALAVIRVSSRQPHHRHVQLATSFGVALCGSYWFVERAIL